MRSGLHMGAVLVLALGACVAHESQGIGDGDEISGDPGGPGVDGSAPDVGPEPGVEIGGYLAHGTPTADGFEESLCYYFCHFNAHCGAVDFGGKQQCFNACRDMLEDGQGVNVACFVASCRQADACLVEVPLPVPPECDALCDGASGCPGLAWLGLTPEPEACRITCAGRAVAIPSFGAALSCMEDPLRACDLDTALGCLADGATFCPTLCLEVGGCGADAPFSQIYATQEACFEACESMSVPGAFRASECFGAYECQVEPSCFESQPACAEYVDYVGEHCGPGKLTPPAKSLAREVCDLHTGSPYEGEGVLPGDTSHMPACLDTAQCQGLKAFPCIFEPDPRCAPLCEEIATCDVYPFPDCYAGCSTVTQVAVLDQMEECAATGSCALLDQCFAGLTGGEPHDDEPGVNICDTWCETGEICGLWDPTERAACGSLCEATLISGDVHVLWDLGCYESGGCGAFEACESAPVVPDGACYDACNTLSSMCHHLDAAMDGGLSACVALCSGVVQGAQGAPGGDLGSCVAAQMDHDCQPGDLGVCLGGDGE